MRWMATWWASEDLGDLRRELVGLVADQDEHGVLGAKQRIQAIAEGH